MMNYSVMQCKAKYCGVAKFHQKLFGGMVGQFVNTQGVFRKCLTVSKLFIL